MTKWIKSSIVSLVLLATIIAVLWIGYVGFIGGPVRAYEREDQFTIEAMMKAKGYNKTKLLNRFSFDEVYYIVQVTDTKPNVIVWFTKDFKKVVKHDFVALDAMEKVVKPLNLNMDSVNYAVYKDKLVFVVKTNSFEAFYNIENLEPVFQRGEV